MKIKTLFLLCGLLMLLFSNVYSEEKTKAVSPDEKIKKYEVRGVMDTEEPSVSIYYEGKQLGWMKPGQKKGDCLLKAYDKETKEAVLEIKGKQYRLREGIKYVTQPDFENDELTLYVSEIENKKILKIYSKKSDKVFNFEELAEIVDKNEKFKANYMEILLYGAYQFDLGGEQPIDLSNKKNSISLGGGGNPDHPEIPKTLVVVKAGD